MLECNTPACNICGFVSARLGRTFVPQQLANLKRLRLDSDGELTRLKTLLTGFCAFDELHLLVTNDQEGQACAFVMQTGIQRTFFQRWSDSLTLD